MTTSTQFVKNKKSEIPGFIIERTAKRMKQYYQKMLKDADTGITVDQWIILQTIHKDNGLSQFEIANQTFKDAPTVTRIIDLLVDKELIERVPDPSDRRKFNICLTKKGDKRIEQVQPIVMDFRKKGWKGISLEDLNHTMRTLNAIFENLED